MGKIGGTILKSKLDNYVHCAKDSSIYKLTNIQNSLLAAAVPATLGIIVEGAEADVHAADLEHHRL